MTELTKEERVELRRWCEDCIKHNDIDDVPSQVISLLDALDTAERTMQDGICAFTDFGRGDCEHTVGLPGNSIPGQHDGPDDTVDAFGKPNGWCWPCWRLYQIFQYQQRIEQRTDRAQKEADETRRTNRELRQRIEQLERELKDAKTEELRIHNDKVDHFEAKLAAERKVRRLEAIIEETEREEASGRFGAGA